MQLCFSGSDAEVISTYGEKQSYDNAGVPFPPKAAGMKWDSEKKVWWCPARIAGIVNEVRRMADAGAAIGLPGLTETEDGTPAEREESGDPVCPEGVYKVEIEPGLDITIRVDPLWEGCDKPAGTLVLSVQTGQDFTKVGFVATDATLRVWSRAQTLGEELLAACQEAVYILAQGGESEQVAAKERAKS